MKRTRAIDREAAEQVRRRRADLGLSQNAVALALGISESTVSKYETLRVPIPPDAFIALDRFLSAAERRPRE